jgi:hypothetical protein
MARHGSLLRDTNVSVEKIPTPTDIQRAILNALSDNLLHYTALRRTLRTQWTTLPPNGLDDALEALLQQNRIELVRNGQSVVYRLRRRKV